MALRCYSSDGLAAEFRCGELITDLEQVVRLLPDSAETRVHPYALVASQDCDLAADYRERLAGRTPPLNSILLFEAYPADAFLAALPMKSQERKQVRQNQNARYHFMMGVPPARDLLANGVDALVIDLRRYFTMSADDITHQIADAAARRRSRLTSPYCEDFHARAFYYMGRVALPDPPA